MTRTAASDFGQLAKSLPDFPASLAAGSDPCAGIERAATVFGELEAVPGFEAVGVDEEQPT